MNRTSLSVIALAVGAVLIIGLYNVYKPQVNSTVHDVFDKVQRPLGDAYVGKKPPETIKYDFNGRVVGKQKIKPNADILAKDLQIPVNYAIAQNIPNAIHVNHDMTVKVDPASTNDVVDYKVGNRVISESPSIGGNYTPEDNHDGYFAISSSYAPGLPSGYHIVNGDGTGSNGLLFGHYGTNANNQGQGWKAWIHTVNIAHD